MARLIDADKIGMHLADMQLVISGGNKALYDLLEDVMEELDDQPTVDAVSVVRCRDCKHWHEEIGWCDEHSYFMGDDGLPCDPSESPNWKMFNADYFCADGERRCEDG